MKIAVIINSNMSTGGWRYVALLLLALLENIPNLFIDIYTSAYNSELHDVSRHERVRVFHKRFKRYIPKQKCRFKILNNCINHIRRAIKALPNVLLRKQLLQEKYDLCFYPWPYGSEPIEVDIPMVFVPHDFTLSHFFSLSGYQQSIAMQVYALLGKFFAAGNAIVSTPFIKDEMLYRFPEHSEKINVIYLSKLNAYSVLSTQQISNLLIKYHIHDNYILWAHNNAPHKNLGQLLGAFYYLKQKYPSLKLLLTGHGTGNFRLKITSRYYADYVGENDDWDIRGLGEIPTDDYSAVLQGASAVVTTSLCEAGNGSGLDAWSMAVPVAMSNIPAFQQQLMRLDVKAELFDPRNDKDIADAISRILDNPSLARKNAQYSKIALEKYTWEHVAKQYAEVFSETIASAKHKN